MTKNSSIGQIPVPRDFKYARVLSQGKPEHDGDYFSVKHPKMSCAKRAKIFAPFAALRGFDFEILCKDIRYEPRRELTEQKFQELNKILNLLHSRTENRHMVLDDPVTATAEYYIPCSDPHHDSYRTEGQYVYCTGIVQYADPVMQTLRIGDTVIAFGDLYSVTLVSGNQSPSG